MHTVVLIAAVAAFVGGWQVTRFFRLKRQDDLDQRRLEEDRGLDTRRHQDQ